jgi:hypothetical protein
MEQDGTVELRAPTASSRRLRMAVGGFVAILVLLTCSSSAFGFAARFGTRYLEPPCCGGDALNGTSASINISSISPDSTRCILFSSDAENSTHLYLLQDGVVRCGSSSSLDGTCSLTNNTVKFVEKEVNGSYTCYAHGSAALNFDHAAVLQNASGTTWSTVLDGVTYETNSFTQYGIYEQGEHAGSDSCTGWSGSARFAANASYPWQRYVQSGATWKTVQSSFSSPGCWSISGGPPGSFTISH